MKKDSYSCVVTIAGSDSSGGAGIQADIKTISAIACLSRHPLYAASVITALTAQNTQGVQSIQEVHPDFVAQQIKSVLSDLNVAAVKIGMLHNESIIDVVSFAMRQFKPPFIVLDPVMVSNNGAQLLHAQSVNRLKEKLFSLATLITPNILEAEKLASMRISNEQEQARAAKKLGDDYQVNILIKGGHLCKEQSSDVLYLYESMHCVWFHTNRIHSKNTHGTGCSLSSAIASYLAQGSSLKKAIDSAKNYVTKAILSGCTRNLGHGCGPVDHFYFLESDNP